MSSDAGVLVLAEIERELGLADRLARCIEDPRAPERVRHGLAEMIRFCALMIAAGYADANDCAALRDDPAFKMAVGRLPETGAELCLQPTMCRLENLPTKTALARMMGAMIELFCDSFEQVPRRILLDIDDTVDRVHGHQQLSLFHAHYDSRCFLPIHIYEATTGKPVAMILRPGKTPDGAEVAFVLRHVVRAIRDRWPAVDIVIRGDGHYARPEAMSWLERNGIGYVFGLAGNRILLDRVADLAEDVAVRRAETGADKVRRFRDLRYGARSWKVERRVVARVEATALGSDSRFIVTNLTGAPRWLYEHLYCGRGQAENLIKAHKLHFDSDRRGPHAASCVGWPDVVLEGHSQPVPPADPHRRLLAAASLARARAQDRHLARRPVRHPASRLRQGRRPRHRARHPHQGFAAVKLPLQGKPRPLRRPRPRSAAVSKRATCPRSSPLPSTANTVIEDRNRAHGATHERVPRRVPLTSDE